MPKKYNPWSIQCENCDFCGPDEFTIKVHTGRCHSTDYECGLCHFKAENAENLETHLSKCKIYECAGC